MRLPIPPRPHGFKVSVEVGIWEAALLDCERITGKQEVTPGPFGKFEVRRIRGEEILRNVARSLDFQESRFSVVFSEAKGSPARNSFLKPFGSLPNALSFSNSLKELRFALRQMLAHRL
jgi:hypothetical protein